MAQALERLGIKLGDRVATLAMNHEHHLIAWYGTAGMGGVLHTINPRLFEDQLEYIANHAEDRVLLYDRVFTPVVERMKPKWKTIEHYICFDPAEGETGFREWIDAEDGNYKWVDGDERDRSAFATPAARRAIRRASCMSIARRCFTRLATAEPRYHGPVEAGGRSADRADVPRQRLGRALGRRRNGREAGPFGGLSARAYVPAVPRGEGDSFRRRSDHMADDDRAHRTNRRRHLPT